jgi:acyl dehydratase
MAVDQGTVTVGTELTPFVRTTGFHNWNRYAAVNDEFVPIHMDDEAGRAQGFPGAFGMGNLMWSYLHDLLRNWMGDDGRIVSMSCSFRAPNNRGMTIEARGTVTAVREEGGETLVDLDLAVVDHDAPDTVLVPATATVALPSQGS